MAPELVMPPLPNVVMLPTSMPPPPAEMVPALVMPPVNVPID